MNWYAKHNQHRVEVKIAQIPHEDRIPEEEYRNLINHSGPVMVDTKLNQPFDEQTKLNLRQYIEQMFPNAVPIGAGVSGVGYDLQDGRVLKLTFNDKEIVWATYYKQNPHPHVADVYDIIIIGNHIYGIIMEKLEPLSEYYYQYLYKNYIYRYHMSPNLDMLQAQRQELLEEKNWDQDDPVIRYIDTLISIIESGNQTPDFNPRNIGIKPNGDFALFDFGAHTAYGHGIDEELEEEIRNGL